MKVKIVSCLKDEFWYKDCIGQIFDVVGTPQEDDDLYQIYSTRDRYLMKCDVKIINRKDKLERILK